MFSSINNKEVFDEDYLLEKELPGLGEYAEDEGKVKVHPLYTEYYRLLSEDLSFFSQIDSEDKAQYFME